MNTIADAVRVYLDRQSRVQHPDGRFDGGRWFPSDIESQSCCGVRSPSRSWPWSLMLHCRTLRHVARLCDVSEAELRSATRPERVVEKEGGDHYYKAVAVAEDGRWLSIYDGTTEYRIGKTLAQRTRQDHRGGYYAYATREEAKHAAVPRSSALFDAERVILRVRAEGSYCRYDRKLSFSRITPLEVTK